MRKKLLLFLSFMLSLWSYGQFTFPTVTGPISVSGGTAENVLINDAANAAAVPAGLYDSFSVSVDWVSTSSAWASETDLTFNTSGGSVTIDPPTTGSANSGAATTLTFSGSLTSLYDPSVDGLLTLDLNQSYSPSDADWSNIVVTLFEAPACPDPLDLGITNLTATTVDLGWTEFGTATTWNVEYGAAGFSQGSGTMVNGTTTNPHNLTGLTPETVYEFYVQSDCGGTDQSNWVGPFEFTTPPSCPAPTDLAITNLTTTSADLGWTNGGSETAWNVEYGAAGFSQGSGTVVNTTSNPHNLTGLTAETAYEFYVQADCGGTDQSTWAGPFSFYTGYCLPSASGTATYIDNFTTSNGSTNISNLASGHTAGGYFDGTAQAVSSYELGSFDFNAEIVGGTVGFAIWIDWNNDLVFDNATEKVFNTTGYGNGPFTGTISVPSGTSLGNYRMRITIDYSSSNPSDPCADRTRAEFEDYTLTITAPPSCLPPSNLMASNITATSADIGWTNGGSETAWNVEYGPAGFTQGSGTTVNATTNPHNLTGLSDNTQYEVYVQADCGGTDQSYWFGPYTFTTLCVPYGIPYFEGFETGYTHNTDVDGCLTQESEAGTSTWKANNTLTTYNRTPRTGDWNAFLGYSNTDWMFIPVQLVGGTSYTMDIYARQDGSTAANAKVEISYGASGDAASMTDVIIAETGVVDNQYQLLTGTFTPATSGVYYIGIKGIVNSSPWYLSVDDIAVYETPSCLPPSSLMASNITTTSADIGWTNGGSETAWNIEYGPVGFTQGSGTTVNATTNPHNLTGLSDNTQYEVYVQADCGGGDLSPWTGPFTFTTLCVPYGIPYFEGFETGYTHNTDVGGCLSQEAEVGTQAWTANNTLTSYNRSPRTGAWNAFLTYSNTDWMFIPVQLVGGTSYTMDIYARQDGSTAANAKVEISYGASGDAASMTDVIVAETGVVDNQYQLLTGTFTPATSGVYYIGIKGIVNGSPWYLSVDDIAVYETPSCLAPTDLAIQNLSSTSVDLTWTENNSATTWNVEYGPAGFTPGTGTVETATTNPHTITITPNTDYEFYVQSDCGGGDLSTWAGPFAFSNTYCTPQATNASRYIDDFSTTNGVQDVTNNGTGFSVDGYGDFTAQQISQTLGQTIDFSTTIVGGTAGFRVWIDWDNDFQFDASDVVYQSSGYSATHTGTITVPVGTTPGPKRMRIVSHWLSDSGDADPCETGFTYGEFEDYTFEVLPAPPCLDPTDFVASNMTGSSVDLSWTANGTATEWNIEYGANGFTQGTGTTETGVTANPYTLTGLTQGTDYDVYIQSDCGVNQGTWVGPLSFSTTTCTPTTGDTTAVACDSFEWFGTTYTASGTATHVLTNSAGCDSTVTLTLTINTSATGTDTQTACGSFTWIDGVEYTASNNTAMYTIVGGAANGCDSIVTLDLTINQVATGTDVQASCGPFTWIDGVEYTASNNTAMHTIVGGAANGCDSIVTLNLTVDTEVSAGNDNAITVCKGEQVDLDTLLSADADAGGTWYNSMNTPLASSVILSSFTAGNYDYTYEVVGSGACPDQTAVITVTVDGGCTADVNEEILGNISVYPNPTTSVLNIVNPSNTSSLRIEMLDMNGRVVMVENSALNNATEATLTIDHLEKGIYTLRVYNNEGHKTFKIVKQ
nr:fibronectin type III domain-containing protein [uncultured Brumimicrobium sp.]